MFRALALAWALWLAACLPATDDDGGGGSVLGGWSQQLGTCQQRLAVAADGTFAYASRMLLGDLARTSMVTGTYAGSPAAGGDGVASLAVAPDAGAAGLASPYCAAWHAAPVQSLALTSLLSGMELTAAELRLQPEYDPTHGVVWLATDAARTDRLALFQKSDGRVEGYSLDPAAVSPLSLYHAQPLDLSTAPPLVAGLMPLNMPGQVFVTTEAANGTPQLETKLLVNAVAALDLSMSAEPGSGLPVCKVLLYEDAAFSTEHQTLDAGTPLEINPLDSGFPFVTVPITGDEGSNVAYLVALGVHSLVGSACAVRLSAGFAAVRRAAAHGATPGISPDLSLPAQAGRHWAVPRSATDPSMVLLPWGGAGLARAGGVLSPWLVGLTAEHAAVADVLGLAAGGQSAVSLAVGDTALSLVAGTGATAGPLTRYQPPTGVGTLPLPGAWDGGFAAGETAHSYRLMLPVAQRIEAHVEGSLALRAGLADADGALRAAAAAGAPDGVGFGLAVSLPAGAYDVTVFSNGAVGAYRLVTAVGGTPLVPDAALEQCLREAGATRSPPVAVRLAHCAGRGIASLAGLEGYPDIGVLELSGNRVGDLSPLASLTGLERLALDGNPVGSLSSLLGLTRLRRLSLGHMALPAAALSPLSALSGHLEVLNLTGNSALSEAEAATLRASLPHTLIVTPAGDLLD
jgi:hypothetical protein